MTQQRTTRKRPEMKNCWDQTGQWLYLWVTGFTDDWFGRTRPTMGRIIPWQVGLGCIREVAEQKLVSKPVSRPWFLLQVQPWLKLHLKPNQCFPPLNGFWSYNKKKLDHCTVWWSEFNLGTLHYEGLLKVFLWPPHKYHNSHASSHIQHGQKEKKMKETSTHFNFWSSVNTSIYCNLYLPNLNEFIQLCCILVIHTFKCIEK